MNKTGLAESQSGYIFFIDIPRLQSTLQKITDHDVTLRVFLSCKKKDFCSHLCVLLNELPSSYKQKQCFYHKTQIKCLMWGSSGDYYSAFHNGVTNQSPHFFFSQWKEAFLWGELHFTFRPAKMLFSILDKVLTLPLSLSPFSASSLSLIWSGRRQRR